MKKKIISLTLALSLGATGVVFADTSYSTAEAISKYKKYIHADSYVKDELYNVADFQSKYASKTGTLAYQVVERAIWYMEHGYFVYGHGTDAYGKYGYEDCSGFTRLVFGDFGINVTGTARNYDSVGTKVEGVGKKQVNGKWQLTGVNNLRIGDVLTWKKDGKISHVAIYMGTNRDGQPVVIGTRNDGNPTGLGTVDSWSYWWGEAFHSARRVLPDNALSGMAGYKAQAPVIPKKYVLTPQKKVPAWTGGAVKPPQVTPKPTPPPTPKPPQVTPTPPPDTDKPIESTKQYIVTKKGWVSLKASPKQSSSTVGKLELGQKAELIKKTNQYWYQVKVNGKTAYITANSTYTSIVKK